MFEDKFMDSSLHGTSCTDHSLPYLCSYAHTLPRTRNVNHILNNQLKNGESRFDFCEKLSQMCISGGLESGALRFDPNRLYDQNLLYDRFYDVSYDRQGSFRGVSPGILVGDSDDFRQTMDLNHRDFLVEYLNGSFQHGKYISRGDTYQDSLVFGGNRIPRPHAATECSGELGFSDLEDSLIFQSSNRKRSSFNEIKNYFNVDQAKSSSSSSSNATDYGLPMSLAAMVKIYGSVYLMAKDQIGCRILQKLIDEGPFVVNIIFLEVIVHVTELAIDPFGNYFVQKLLDVCSEEQRTQIVSMLTLRPMQLIKISLNTYGTRVVQKMIETVRTKSQLTLVKSGIKPGFLVLVKDLNGNHVIQRCLQSFGSNDIKFVLEAATRYCTEIATHRHGCCVLQRCVLYSVGEQRERLVAEISRNSLHLAQDPFGNYVVQYIIEQKVATANLLYELREHYVELATQKFSSHVVEKCLRYYPESRAEIVREFLSVPNFEHLLQDPFANYVIQAALSVTKGFVRASLVDKVRSYGNLRSSPYCKKIFSRSLLKK